jgi:hypothetical protein
MIEVVICRMETWFPDGERKDPREQAQVEEGRNAMEEEGRDERDGGRSSWKGRRRSEVEREEEKDGSFKTQ